MTKESILKGKVVLVVDDEPDVLDTVEDMLDMCIIHKAENFKDGHQLLLSYTYDVVILDIMGVDGFELLKISVTKKFPTVMLTAHAVTPDSLKKSIKLGAVTFLPKDKISELQNFLEEAVLDEGKPLWQKLFLKMEGYFNDRFGPDWKEKDKFFEEFEKSFKQ